MNAFGSLIVAFEKADLVLITHTHGDHLHVDTLRAVVKDGTVLAVPAKVATKLPEDLSVTAKVLANGDAAEVVGAKIEAMAAYNLTEERLKFHPRGEGNGYVLTIGGTRIYIAGDTEDIPEMKNLKNVDAAFVCMNLPYTMDVAHAAEAVLELDVEARRVALRASPPRTQVHGKTRWTRCSHPSSNDGHRPKTLHDGDRMSDSVQISTI